MNESPDDWLRRLFEFEFCAECGGDADDHIVSVVLGSYFAWCKRSHVDEPPTDETTSTLTDGETP